MIQFHKHSPKSIFDAAGNSSLRGLRAFSRSKRQSKTGLPRPQNTRARHAGRAVSHKSMVGSVAFQALSVVKVLGLASLQQANKMFALTHIDPAWQHARHGPFVRSKRFPVGSALLVDWPFADNHHPLSFFRACLACNDHKGCDSFWLSSVVAVISHSLARVF